MIKKCVFSLLSLFIVLINVFFVRAYMDVGTATATISSGLWPIILAIVSAITAFLIKYFWKPIKSFFMKFKEKDFFTFKK